MARDIHSLSPGNIANATRVGEGATSSSYSLTCPASPGDLFVTFTLLALQGYGGVLAVAQRVLCEQ